MTWLQVLPGLDAPPAAPAEVAKYTVRTIMRTTPAAVPGIHFLSGAAGAHNCNGKILTKWKLMNIKEYKSK